MPAELAVGGIALILLGVFVGGYLYDTRKNRAKLKQKP